MMITEASLVSVLLEKSVRSLNGLNGIGRSAIKWLALKRDFKKARELSLLWSSSSD